MLWSSQRFRLDVPGLSCSWVRAALLYVLALVDGKAMSYVCTGVHTLQTIPRVLHMYMQRDQAGANF